jgi:transcription elongation factor GreA
VTELRRVEAVLAQAQPIPAHVGASDEVSLGDAITVEFLGPAGSDVEWTEVFVVVHPFEAPLDIRRISVASPLGRAVVGQRIDDVVTFDTPTGARSVRIRNRQPTP